MPAAKDPTGRAFTCGACPPGYAGNGTVCLPCPLSASFSPSDGVVGRAATLQLFGRAATPASVGGFACPSVASVTFAWSGTQDDAALPLGAANQVNTPALYLPPRSLASNVNATFTLQACFASVAGVTRLCAAASGSFAITSSPLVPVVSGGNATVGTGATVVLDASQARARRGGKRALVSRLQPE